MKKKKPIEELLTEAKPLTLKPGESDRAIQQLNELSSSEKGQLLKWILSNIKRAGQIFETHFSSDIKKSFENSSSGFPMSHDAFKGAMLTSGFHPISRMGRDWGYKIDIRSIPVKDK